MSGTRIGGLKAVKTNKKRFGKDHFRVIGAIGGRLGHTGGFNSGLIGADGLTGFERASVAGRKGGKASKRGKNKR